MSRRARRLLLGIIALVVVALGVVYLPTRTWFDQQREMAADRKRLERLESTNDRLAKKLDRLSDARRRVLLRARRRPDGGEPAARVAVRPAAGAGRARRRPRRLTRRSAHRLRVLEEVEGVHAERLGDALHGSKREVALAPFDGAEVGAVHAHDVGEGLLGQTQAGSVTAEVRAQPPGECFLHGAAGSMAATRRSTDR